MSGTSLTSGQQLTPLTKHRAGDGSWAVRAAALTAKRIEIQEFLDQRKNRSTSVRRKSPRNGIGSPRSEASSSAAAKPVSSASQATRTNTSRRASGGGLNRGSTTSHRTNESSTSLTPLPPTPAPSLSTPREPPAATAEELLQALETEGVAELRVRYTQLAQCASQSPEAASELQKLIENLRRERAAKNSSNQPSAIAAPATNTQVRSATPRLGLQWIATFAAVVGIVVRRKFGFSRGAAAGCAVVAVWLGRRLQGTS